MTEGVALLILGSATGMEAASCKYIYNAFCDEIDAHEYYDQAKAYGKKCNTLFIIGIIFISIIFLPACNNSSKKIKVSYNEQFDDEVELLNKAKGRYFWFEKNRDDEFDLYQNNVKVLGKDEKNDEINVNFPQTVGKMKKKIKIAIIDDGVDLNCLNKDKIWKNEGEIPDNNIDDDNNGYVDDIHGYDFVHNSGNVSSDTNGYHGNYISSILIGYNQKLGYKSLLNDYNVEVIILKVLNGEESIGNIRDIKRAIDYAEMVGAYDKAILLV